VTLRNVPRLLIALVVLAPSGAGAQTIDRQEVVSRHDPVLRKFDREAPLSVGNGEFAFTADVTGLQTFAEAFEETIPLGTLSQWAWHTWPNPNGWNVDRFGWSEFESHGRKVGYADIPGDKRTPEIEWLRANPHRLHLGRVSFRLLKADGKTAATPEDLTEVEQRLDLWNGVLLSRFRLDGETVEVETLSHSQRDVLAVRVRSALLKLGRIAVELHFPYGTGAVKTADWGKPDAHLTKLTKLAPNRALFERRLDTDAYAVAARWSVDGVLEEQARHRFLVKPAASDDTFALVLGFAPKPAPELPSFETARAVTRDHWNRFWSEGAAIDLSESKDPRWKELERRIVLSQYLTAIQCAGRYPPQETGLTFNSWEGKFHLEMHWWHAAQFALWGRLPLLEKSLGYYQTILPKAQAAAKRQGYAGARWPKMTSPGGDESPSSVGPFLVWQQPHPIFYAELVLRERRDRATLDRFKDVVFQSAEFMASFAAWDEAGKRFVLGPPLQCAQEVFPKDTTQNCSFELTYWRWGLETAQRWRERLKLPREPNWEKVLQGLAKPVVADGRYLFAETAQGSYTDPRFRRDHPAVLASLGVLPGPGVDLATMSRTLQWVRENWNWPETWGWDYPMVAMTAARLGQTRFAVDALLVDTPKNVYRANGHNHQRPGLTIYLPGNGGLLYAVAMMAAGWDGAPDREAPGFPNDGSWTVRFEGLKRAP
jgi:hypothetical protein